MVIGWIGVALLALVAVHTGVTAFASIQRLSRQRAAIRREALTFRASISRLRRKRSAARVAIAPWSGWRKFQVVERRCEDQEGQVCSFYLRPHDGRSVPAHKPGQYLTFQVPIEGRAKPEVRCYSLSDSARPGTYRISVKKIAPTPASPKVHPGIVSCYLHDHIQQGAILDVKPPDGQFFLDLDNPAPVVLIGGGVGVTPVLAMLNAIAETNWPHEVWFFYGVRNSGEQAFGDYFRELERTHPKLNVRLCYSQPTPTDKQGVDFDHAGRVNIDLLKSELKVNNYNFYLCGPGPFMNDLLKGLKDWGVPDERVHSETFGPSAPPPGKPDPNAAGPSIVFRRSSKTTKWDPAFASIWDFANAADVPISCGCRSGKCGECKVAVVSGEVKYNAPPSYAIEPGSCLTCCSQPKGDLVLDA